MFCRYILSCGADGDVRTWDGFDDSDAASYQIGETVYCVIYKVRFVSGNIASFMIVSKTLSHPCHLQQFNK